MRNCVHQISRDSHAPRQHTGVVAKGHPGRHAAAVGTSVTTRTGLALPGVDKLIHEVGYVAVQTGVGPVPLQIPRDRAD